MTSTVLGRLMAEYKDKYDFFRNLLNLTETILKESMEYAVKFELYQNRPSQRHISRVVRAGCAAQNQIHHLDGCLREMSEYLLRVRKDMAQDKINRNALPSARVRQVDLAALPANEFVRWYDEKLSVEAAVLRQRRRPS